MKVLYHETFAVATCILTSDSNYSYSLYRYFIDAPNTKGEMRIRGVYQNGEGFIVNVTTMYIFYHACI